MTSYEEAIIIHLALQRSPLHQHLYPQILSGMESDDVGSNIYQALRTLTRILSPRFLS